MTSREINKFNSINLGIFISTIILATGILCWLTIEMGLPDKIFTVIKINSVAPDFTLTNLQDQHITLSKLRGKPTIINFWATWCLPCIAELPVLHAAYTKHRQKINFLAIDVREQKSIVRPFAYEKGLVFPILLDTDGQVNTMYQVRGIPTTIFVDAEGVILNRHIGTLDEATLETYLKPLLQKE